MSIKWDRNSITEAMHQCTSLSDFKKKYRGAFNTMERNGWEDLKVEIPGFHPHIGYHARKSKLKWTREAISAVIKQCPSLAYFHDHYDQAARVLRKNRWSDLLDLIPRKHSKPIIWTEELITDIISKCNNRNEFCTEYAAAYQAMRRNGWHHLLDSIPRNPRGETTETEWSVYRWLFPGSHSVYIGISNNYARRIYQELRYSYSSPVHDHLVSTGDSYRITELHHELSGAEAADLEIAYIEKYRNEGYNVLNRNRGGSLGGYKRQGLSIDDERLLTIIRETYYNYAEFKANGGKLYKECKARKLLDALFHTMPGGTGYEKYSKAELRALLSRYLTLGDFIKAHHGEYRYILSHKWHDILHERGFSPMEGKMPKIPDTLGEIVEKINRGDLTQTEAAKILGLTTHYFRKFTKGMIHQDITMQPRHANPVNTGTGQTGKRVRPSRSKESILAEIDRRFNTLSEFRNAKTFYRKVKRWGLYHDASDLLKKKQAEHASYMAL